MGAMKRMWWTLVLLLNSMLSAQKANAQSSQYDKGFEKGFANGFCYNNSSGATCLAPMAPMPPFPRINESSQNYQEGYNRGFQTGLDLQRLSGNRMDYPGYEKFINSYKREAFKSSDYVPPVDLKLLEQALREKQKLFDARYAWIQKRIDDIGELHTNLFSRDTTLAVAEGQDYLVKDLLYNEISKFVDEINQKGGDLTDPSVFSYYAGKLYIIEATFYNVYTSLVERRKK